MLALPRCTLGLQRAATRLPRSCLTGRRHASTNGPSRSLKDEARKTLHQARDVARDSSDSVARARPDQGYRGVPRARIVKSQREIQDELLRRIRTDGPVTLDSFMQTINDSRPRSVGWHTGDLREEDL